MEEMISFCTLIILVFIKQIFLEENPDTIFTAYSPDMCWEMVRRCLKEKISKIQNEGRNCSNLYQYPSTPLDGLKMFGFLISNEVIQVKPSPSS